MLLMVYYSAIAKFLRLSTRILNPTSCYFLKDSERSTAGNGAPTRVERVEAPEGLRSCGDWACQRERLAVQQEAKLSVQEAMRQLAVTQARLTAAGASEEQLRAEIEEWKVRNHWGLGFAK